LSLEYQQAQPLASRSPTNDRNVLEKKARETQKTSSPSFSPDDSDSPIDPDALIPEFLSLQSQLYYLQPNLFHRSSKLKKANENKYYHDPSPQIASIQQKISKIEKDVLFDHTEAERIWREKLISLNRESAFIMHRDRELSRLSTDDEDEERKMINELKPEKQSPSANDESLGFFGNMFSDNSSTSGMIPESVPHNGHILIRDFGHSSGLSPRRVLEECCKARYEY
jgi:ATP-dependent RNA helicase DHX29